MDLQMLIVVICIFFASLMSLLCINKVFKRKTFEEVVAEKKALAERVHGHNKLSSKKPKKVKKEQKREKKLRQRDQQRDNEQQDESDIYSEQTSVEEDPPKTTASGHIEFDLEPEVIPIVDGSEKPLIRHGGGSNGDGVECFRVGPITKLKVKKEKKIGKTFGILVNKNEPIAVKENEAAELNHFDIKQPKDVIELKKVEKEKEKKEKEKEKEKEDKQSLQLHLKKEKSVRKEKQAVSPTAEKSDFAVNAPKETVKMDEKIIRHGSPKSANAHSNGKTKQHQSSKKQNKENLNPKGQTAATFDILSQIETISVPVVCSILERADLTRSEIQILIDYLLNKQQDMPATHSEWSDDICQKLKRQLEEKERALREQQETSIGLQEKLRELRSEVNAERTQLNATIRAYMEKVQAKEQDVASLNLEIQAMNEKFAVERQQFQAKLIREKQAQDLHTQVQLLTNELSHKDNCIAELRCLVNASRQAVEESQQKSSDIIQSKVQQIRSLEQQRDELEQLSNKQVFQIEQAKILEVENSESKVELRNLQNALESAKAEVMQSHKDLDVLKTELTMLQNVELVEGKREVEGLMAHNNDLKQKIIEVEHKLQERLVERTGLQNTLDYWKKQTNEREQQVAQLTTENTELDTVLAEARNQLRQQTEQQRMLRQSVDCFKTEANEIATKLVKAERIANDFNAREQQLLQQLQEQSEKNNDLRRKNWKLVEALQNAETTFHGSKQLSHAKSSANASNAIQQRGLDGAQISVTTASTTTIDLRKDQDQIRDLLQRLYPDAVTACSSNALSLSFEQWVEAVLNAHIKLSLNGPKSSSDVVKCSSKATQASHNNFSHNIHTNMNNMHSNLSKCETQSVAADTSNDSCTGSDASVIIDSEEVRKLRIQNAQLRTNVDELTKLAKKTGNTLSELEARAREQDEHWRNVVRSKDEQINSLQHSNGEQDM